MRRIAILLCVLLPLIGACTAPPAAKETFVLGTVCNQTIYEGGEQALQAGEQLLYKLDATLSVFREGSEVSKINAYGSAKVSEDVLNAISTALSVSESSAGAFDITVGKLTQQWDITGNPKVPSDQAINSLLKYVDYKQVKINAQTVSIGQDQRIDLGGVAKGYAANKLAALYKDQGVKSALLNLGGNIYAVGSKHGQPFTVGIKDPLGQADYFGTVKISDTSIVTSGAYERYFEQDGKRYHHILNPKTGYPAQSDILSVSIIHPDSAFADAMSTAVFVLGSEKGLLLAQGACDALIVKTDRTIVCTKGFYEKYNFELKGDYKKG